MSAGLIVWLFITALTAFNAWMLWEMWELIHTLTGGVF